MPTEKDYDSIAYPIKKDVAKAIEILKTVPNNEKIERAIEVLNNADDTLERLLKK